MTFYVAVFFFFCQLINTVSQWVAPLSNDFIENVLLEAVDQASGHERRVVLAKVADVIGIRLLLSLIGCPDTHPGQVVYVDSPDIHPIGWCRAQGKQLGIPVGTLGVGSYNNVFLCDGMSECCRCV